MEVLKVLLLVSPIISTTLACRGYSIQNLEITSCGANIIEINNVNAYLQKNCTIKATGTVVTNENIKDCNISLTGEKKSIPPVKITAKKNMCKLIKDSKSYQEITQVLNSINITDCPILKTTFNLSKAMMSMGKHQDKLDIFKGNNEAGVKGICTVVDDEGKESTVKICFKASFTLAQTSGPRNKMFSG